MNKNTTSHRNTCTIEISLETLKSAAEILSLVITFLTSVLGNRTAAKKTVAIIFLAIGFPVSHVVTLSGMGRSSAYKLWSKVRAGLTIDELSNILNIKGNRGRPNKLTAKQKQEIVDHIDTHNFFTLRHIADYIKETHGITMALSSVKDLLKEFGIKKYKCGSLPAKADPKAQREFYEDTLKGLLDRNEKGEIKLFFMDGAHFVIGTDFTPAIYGRTRRFCQTFSGRKRYNVLGAVEFASKKILTVTNEDYITATTVVSMFNQIKDACKDIPVYIVLDNARYQKCKLVKDAAAESGINLEYLPSYSPNLNLIERLWKYTKAELRSQYYENFEVFKERIDTILEEAQTTRKHMLESLITREFQFFDDMDLVDRCTYASKESVAG